MNAAPGMHIAIDALLLPFFPEFQDTGIEYASFPLNARLGLIFDYVKTDYIHLSFGPWIGAELVSQYKKLYWGLEHSLSVNITPVIGAGLKIQAAELEFEQGLSHAISRAECGVSYKAAPLGLSLSYLLEEQYQRPYNREYHTFKAGMTYILNTRFILLGGFNYQLATGAWTASLGMDMPGISLFKRSVNLGTAFTYNPVGGISFHLSLRWDQSKL